MFRYIVIIWNVNNASECDAVSDMRRRIQGIPINWRSALDHPGMYVACVDRESSSDAAVPIAHNRGLILGTMFQSPEYGFSISPKPIRHLSGDQSEKILRSRGRSLISDCWGYYVAALHYPETASAVVVRSPVSPLACFHVERGTLNVFFSHLNDCIELKITSLSINWDSITAQVIGGDYLTNETAIKEIDSLECGEGVQCNRDGCSKHSYWDPRSFLAQKVPASFADATKTFRHATEYCVSALSSGHDSILVKLSGGLDSSIVLGSLSRASRRPSLTAVNYYSSGSGDERRFARSMARAADCRLVERLRNHNLDLRRFLDCNRTVRPVLNFSAPDVELRNNELARELNATAIFDGELGDNIFGSHPNLGVLVECFAQSTRRAFFRVALDYSMLTRQSVWRTLAQARREALSMSANPDFSASRVMQRALGVEGARSAILASAEAEEYHAARADRFLHPWLKQSRRIAPGSHGLLFGLITVTSATYHSPFSGPYDPMRVSPLVSQPLLESALRMPPYLHCHGAEDRAVARAAFADVLPTEILQRGLGKGGPTLWVRAVIESNTGFLREFLLDGILVRQRLLDRKKLETVLSPRIVKTTVVAGDIFAKLYIEAWLRAWSPVETLPAGKRMHAGG